MFMFLKRTRSYEGGGHVTLYMGLGSSRGFPSRSLVPFGIHGVDIHVLCDIESCQTYGRGAVATSSSKQSGTFSPDCVCAPPRSEAPSCSSWCQESQCGVLFVAVRSLAAS